MPLFRFKRISVFFFFLQNQKIPCFFFFAWEFSVFKRNSGFFFSDLNLWSPSSMWIWNKIWGGGWGLRGSVIYFHSGAHILLIISSIINILIELKKSGEKRKSGLLRSIDLLMFRSTCRPILRVCVCLVVIFWRSGRSYSGIRSVIFCVTKFGYKNCLLECHLPIIMLVL